MRVLADLLQLGLIARKRGKTPGTHLRHKGPVELASLFERGLPAFAILAELAGTLSAFEGWDSYSQAKFHHEIVM